MRRRYPIEVISIASSSRKALEMAAAGGAHVAGVHLRDPKTGEYNFTAAREAFGRSRFKVVHFARWELGLATRVGRGSLGDIEDLTKRRLRLINREPGSGARVALDEAFASRGIKAERIHGYYKLASGHLEVAAAIAAGVADAGVTIRLAADLYDLEFLSWREERYDLIVADDEFKSPPMQSLMEALNSRALAHEINGFCAYDTSQMGDLVTAQADRTT
jgi:putative molybdopterin biosynthesis protein